MVSIKCQKCLKRFGDHGGMGCHSVTQADLPFSLLKGVWARVSVYLVQDDASKTPPSFFHPCCFSAFSQEECDLNFDPGSGKVAGMWLTFNLNQYEA